MTTATASVSATPTTAEVIRVAMEALLVGKFKCRPGRVESYDAARQVVSAKPMLKRRLAAAGGQEIVESMQVVSDVPVMFPRSRSFFVSFPLAAGDYVLLVGVDQSIDAFVASQEGTDVDPDDFRWWDATDVVAFPGFWPSSAALPDASATNLVVGHSGGPQVQVSAIEILLGASAVEAVLKGTSFLSAFNTWRAALNAYLAALATLTPATIATAATTYATAEAAFAAALGSVLSVTVKTE